MQIRTDLALEKREIYGKGEIEGVRVTEEQNSDCKSCEIDVLNAAGASALGKPEGKYITVEMDALPDSASMCDGRLDAICAALEKLLPESGSVLVAGLGNTAITPDALGPQCAELIFATRHIPQKTREELRLPALREVSAVIPGVTGKTGIEATEIIASIVKKIKPSAIITVDALAAMSVKRLAKTVQLCNTGIEPGSGVGNARSALNEETLGAPVIALGVPTVVDALSIARDVAGDIDGRAFEEYSLMMVTPRDTDVITRSAARLLALAINCTLQKNLSREELISLM